jgi:hypothetical protein
VPSTGDEQAFGSEGIPQNVRRPDMESETETIESSLAKIEYALLDRALAIRSLEDLMRFYFCYLSVYTPALEFTAENLPENEIAGLANFGITVDRLMNLKANEVVSMQADLAAREISSRTSKPRSEINKALGQLSIAQKYQLSISVLAIASLSRDATLCEATGKFDARNKIVAWCNILGYAVRIPAMASLYLSREVLDEAREELEEAKALIAKRDRSYDAVLAARWSNSMGLSERNLVECPKYFLGQKVEWLEAMQGLEFCRYLLCDDPDAPERALMYNSKLRSLLTTRRQGKSEWSYRNLNSGGPTANLQHLVEADGDEPIRIELVDTRTFMVIRPGTTVILTLPGGLDFYTNERITVTRDMPSDDGRPRSVTTPIESDPGTFVAFGESPAHFVAQHYKELAEPWASSLLKRVDSDRQRMKAVFASGDAFMGGLEITYGELSVRITETLRQLTKNAAEAVVVYGGVYTIEQLAKTMGLPVAAEPWSEVRLAITAILLQRFRPALSRAQTIEDEGREEFASTTSLPYTAEDKIRLLEQRTAAAEVQMTAAFSELEEMGLADLLRIARELRELVLSGLTVEEIMAELDARYDATSAVNDLRRTAQA